MNRFNSFCLIALIVVSIFALTNSSGIGIRFDNEKS